MKLLFSYLLLLYSSFAFSQNHNETSAFDIDILKGNLLLHTPNLSHLITGHPSGFMISYSRKTFGNQEWQSLYNFPDYGSYFLYQDFKNENLGKNYALGTFYNFYFFHRNVTFKIASGVAMTTNPHDNVTNNKNVAFGSKFMGNINLALNYRKENIIDKFGFQTGITFTHFSNGRIKSPNLGLNTYSFNLGLNYNFNKSLPKRDSIVANMKFTEPIKYNFVLRTGLNESPVIGSGQKPFYHISFYADKRINKKSGLQLGTEVFFTNTFKEYIRYRAIAFPEDNLSLDTDYKRVSVFIGHELFISKVSLEAQLGYYVYSPFQSELTIYDRLGIKYHLSDKLSAGLSLKTHIFLAEAVEFSIGYKL
jgi:Lipid A 3-O-deacylase (PagL)